ncbi:MAG: RPA family protein, partial [Haloferacaceae archaeon]
RVFAAEFDDATVSYRESDEERAPNYVVTPTGARVNRLFAVGVLTEVEDVNDEVVRARIADPTGAFVSYAGQYQPDPLAFFERTDPPAFVALTGKARTFEPEDGDRIYSSVRPESVNAVDADTRDRWVVGAAEATLERVALFETALAADLRGEDLRDHLLAEGHPESLAAGIPVAIERYGTTPAYLEAVRRTAVEALELVAGERDAVEGIDLAPDEGGDVSVGATPTLEAERGAAPATGDGTTTAGGAAGATSDDGDPSGEESTDAGAAGSAETAEAAEPAETAEPTETAGSEPAEASDTADTDPVKPAETADAEPTEAAEAAEATESAEASGSVETTESAEASGTSDPVESADDADSLGDFDAESGLDEDEMYELDEEERREVEEEFGTEFSTGTEVGEPGEADIDVPDPEAGDGATAGGDGEAEPAGDGDDEADGDAGSGDVDLEDAAVDAMADLDEGDGADREAVVASVVEEHGADPGDVEDAIQDALMSGRCYEPGEDTLKPI